MIELNFDEREELKKISKNSTEVLVLSAAEGRMGKVFVSDKENTKHFFVEIGDYLYTCGEIPQLKDTLKVNKLIQNMSKKFLIPETEEWEKWFLGNLDVEYDILPRYALKTDENNFDKNNLQKIVDELSDEFELKKIGKEEFEECKKYDWSYDFTGHFKNYEDFNENALGYCIYSNGELVSGSSSYGYCDGRIDIAVATRDDFRKKGLALVTSAKLMLECFEKNIYPNWDAANLSSLGLAKKLGYVFDREFNIFYIK